MLTNLIMLILVCLTVVIYFTNNPMRYAKDYRIRCFLNWFPLGLTYAFLYMGRYNLTVSKGALGSLLSPKDFGDIFGLGALIYGIAFVINGPLTDKIGGKKAILLGTAGTILMNTCMGFVTKGVLQGSIPASHIVPLFKIFYALNMYFQSFGAVSVIKVNSHWFHIKERGIQGGVFGTLISLGLFYAFDWGALIVNATTIHPTESLNIIEQTLSQILHTSSATVNQTWFVFFIPAGILFCLFLILLFLLKESPEEAGFPELETGDADVDTEKISAFAIIPKMLSNPIILTIASIEFCSGILRQSVMQWYRIFVSESMKDPSKIDLLSGATFFVDNWGLLLCLAGITGGFLAGFISDKIFSSRRGPSAAFLYILMFIGAIIMCFTINTQQVVMGCATILISLSVIGVHGMLSGTATMDFGGKKAAATVTGIVDGFVYLGTGFQAVILGRLTSISWSYWPMFMIPFTIIGLLLSIRIWKAFPTR